MRTHNLIPLFLISCLYSPITAKCQVSNLLGGWTTEDEIYFSEAKNDSMLFFKGGNLHEGGAAFAVKLSKNHSYILAAPKEADTLYGDSPSLGKEGDHVSYQLVNGIKVLIMTGKDGAIDAVLRGTAPDEDLSTSYTHNKINFELAGKYINKATNQIVIFHPNESIAEGLTEGQEYTFETAYDESVDVITFNTGKRLYYEQTKTGLDLFKAKSSKDDDDWQKGQKVMSLQLLSPLNITGDASLMGKYAIASAQVITRNIMGYFTPSQLRLMRNEIFARHGYIFKSEDLKSYFSAQSWYKPQYASVDDQLSDLERLNIRILENHHQPNK